MTIVLLIAAYIVGIPATAVITTRFMGNIDPDIDTDLAFVAAMAICWPVTLPFMGLMWFTEKLVRKQHRK